MVAPVTPRNVGYSSTGALVHYVYGYRQKPPFNLLLGYEGRYCKAVPYILSVPISATNGWTTAKDPNSVPAWLYNRAYERYIAKFGNRSQLGASLAEYRQAHAMITARAGQLWMAYKALRRFDFGRVAAILNVSKRDYLRLKRERKLLRGSKNVGNNWLEFHFGWSPLVGDIHDGLKVIADHIPPWRIRAAARFKGQDRPIPLKPSGFVDGTYYSDAVMEMRVRLGATIEIVNPNLWLANSLGLINPLSVAWELVPFSFVADWFFNVSTVISGLTDTAGLKIRDGFVTRSRRSHDWAAYGYGYAWRNHGYLDRLWIRRSIGAPGIPRLGYKPIKLPSWQRALTSFSLLAQAIKEDEIRLPRGRR